MFRALIKLIKPLPAKESIAKIHAKARSKEINRQIKTLRRVAKDRLLAYGTASLLVRGCRDEAISDVVAELRDLGWDVRLTDYYLEIK